MIAAGATHDYSAAPNAPAATILRADVASSGKVPYVEVAVDFGVDSNYHNPKTTFLGTVGDYSIPRPVWANEIDYIVVPAAGGGSTGGALNFFGRPGQSGPWVAGTLIKGEDFDDSDDEVSVHVAEGGEGGGVLALHDEGYAGATTTLSIGDFSLAVPGGEGGHGALFGVRPVANGPGTYVYNEKPYTGGNSQAVTGKNGVAPGGPGNGGSGTLFQPGGDGAPAGVWLVFRQGNTDESGGDTTPPTPPTLVELLDATMSSLTINATGATD